MSIKLLAKDLYRLQKKVDRLAKEMAAAPLTARKGLEERLRVAKAERERLRRALDGKLQR